VCNGGGKPATTTVTATVVTPSSLTISPTKQDFTTKVGQPFPWTFNVTNNGGAKTGTLSAAVTGAGFAITQNSCPASLGALAACTIQVTFNPAAAGAVTGTLTVTDATPGSTPAVATLTGSGVSSAVAITPTPKDLGTVVVGATPATAPFTMSNTGTSATAIIALAASDPQFTVVNDLCSGHALAAQAQCTFSVTFAPTSAGPKQATINATQTADGAVLATANLTGTGQDALKPAHLTISPPTLDFGTTGVGVPVGPKVFTVVNDGGTATGALTTLKNDSTSSVGGASQFNITGNDCNKVLAPNATCQVAVTFAPTITRSASAVIVVSDGVVSTSSTTATTTPPGTVVGIALAIPTLSVSCPAFDSTGTVVGLKETVVCTVTNTVAAGGGDTPQESGAITIAAAGTTPGTAAGDFSVGTNNCTASLQPNLSCTVQLVFTPSAKGKRDGMVTVTSTNRGAANQVLEALGLLAVEVVENATCTPVMGTVLVEGVPTLGMVGCTPVTTSNYDFGQVSLGSTSTTTLTVSVYVRANVGNIEVSGTDFQFPEDTTAPADFTTTGGCAKAPSVAPTPQKTTPYCTMPIVFHPRGKGAKTNTITAKSADGTYSDTGAMQGIGTGPLAIAPSKLTFASVAVGSSSVTPSTLTVCNNSPNPATGATFAVTGANASDFAVVADTVSNQTIDPNGATTPANCKIVQLRLDIPAGAATGPRTATVTVTAVIAGVTETATATLFGTVVSGAGLDAKLNGTFADTPVTRTSDPVTVTVTNTGALATDVLIFDIPAPWGDSLSQFTFDPAAVPGHPAQATCTINETTRLEPNTSCDLKVWFQPTASLGVNVVRRATLVVSSKVGGMKVLDLVGKALPQLAITPASQVIDPTVIGDAAGPSKTFTITNNGGSAINRSDLTLAFRNDTNQTGAAEFHITAANDHCPATLPSALSATTSNPNWCTVDVNLQPVGLSGARSATLYAQVNGTQRATAAVSGTAVTPAQLLLTPDSTVTISSSTVDRDFGTVVFGQKSTPQTFTVTNVGGQKAGKISIKFYNLSTHGADEAVNAEHVKTAEYDTTGSTCLGQSDATVLAPGQTCTIKVAYTPVECPATSPPANCPYTTAYPFDVKMVVFATPGTPTTPAPGGLVRQPKLYGAGSTANSVYVTGPNGLQAYDFGTVSATDAVAKVFTMTNRAATGFTIPAATTTEPAFADTANCTVDTAASTDPAHVVTGATEFAVSNGPASATNPCTLGTTVIPPNGSCVFTVTWTPTSPLADQGGTREVSMTFTGVTPVGLLARVGAKASLLAVPAPIAQTSSPVDFGYAVTDADSVETRTLTIVNVGERATGDIKVARSSTTGAPAQVNALTGTTCQGAGSSVVGGGSCLLKIGVHATEVFDYSAGVPALRIVPATGTATSFMRAGDITVAWKGINPAAFTPSSTTVAFDDSTSSFPGTAVLSTGTSKTLTLTNAGDSAETGAMSFTTDKDDFAIDLDPAHSTCLDSATVDFFDGLQPTINFAGGTAESCTVRLVFSPTALATPAKSGKLTVSSASGATLEVPLTGTAIPALSVAGPTVGFTATTATAPAAFSYQATSKTGYTDAIFVITKAAGSPPTALLSTSIGGDTTATPDQFKIVADTCIGVSLADAPGTPTCQVTVRFAPTAAGTNLNAVLMVLDPSSGTPPDSVSVAVKGDATN